MKALLIILISSFTFAATTNFHLELSIEDLDNESYIEEVSCFVRQTLTWESQANYFKCDTQYEKGVSFKNVFTNVGYIHDARLPYSIYRFGGNDGLINKLAKAIRLDGYIKSRLGLKIYYKDHSLYTSSPEYIIDAGEKTYLLRVSRVYY